MNLKEKIRTVPDFPKKGIMFRDITTLLKDPQGFNHLIDLLTERYKGKKIDLIAGIESRGFIIGSPLAHRLNVGFIPIRKKGKLPAKTLSQEYTLEYGKDSVEIHTDAIQSGLKVLLIDDLIATGGTALAAAQLINKLEGVVVECCFVIDLPELGGRKLLEKNGFKTYAIMAFEGH